MILEFGSDFHSITSFPARDALSIGGNNPPYLFATGRAAVVALIRQEGWHRLWVPEYFCYEVLDSIKLQTGINLCFYQDFPECDDRGVVASLPYRSGDALLRVNFFGTRSTRDESFIPVPVIEDHTHDLLGPWANESNADWCIASLRKTLPMAEGGILWSPKGKELQSKILPSLENEAIASLRWKAMDMKDRYLRGEIVSKDEFRSYYIDTEERLGLQGLCALDKRSYDFLFGFDMEFWYQAKRKNIEKLRNLLNGACTLFPEDDRCNLFSFVLLTTDRDDIKRKLLSQSVYPAVLWAVSEDSSECVRSFSSSMLSIHCDGRYSLEDMSVLAEKINNALV